MRRMFIVLLIFTVALLGATPKNNRSADPPPEPVEEEDIDLDQDEVVLPSIEDLGYFLSRLSEHHKGDALNILMDLAADSRLTRDETAGVLNRLRTRAAPRKSSATAARPASRSASRPCSSPSASGGPRWQGPSGASSSSP